MVALPPPAATRPPLDSPTCTGTGTADEVPRRAAVGVGDEDHRPLNPLAHLDRLLPLGGVGI